VKLDWFDKNDLIFFLSAAAIGYGLWQIFEPAAWIGIGGAFFVLSLLGRFK
jgi:hypothetical protein